MIRMLLLLLLAALPAWAGDSAVVIMYHRFGEGAHPDTNIRLAQVDQHLATLGQGGYRVLPVEEIVRRLQAGEALADRTVGISVDDAHRSFLTEGWPRFKARGLPVTLFVSTDALDAKFPGYVRWEELRAMVREGLAVGHHSAAHPHMAEFDQARAAAEIAKASARFEAEFGRVPALFAFPYGESGLGAEAAVKAAGFTAAFGQQSGALHAGADRWFLPRFAMNEHYGTPERFRQAIDTLALPLGDVLPKNRVLSQENPPRFSFRLDPVLMPRLSALRCYAGHMPGVALPLQQVDGRIEVRIAQPFPRGRARINCTLPAAGGRFHWFGEQFLVP